MATRHQWPQGCSPGELVAFARTFLGLTQAEVAARAGTSQAYVSRVEADLVSPTVDSLARVLASLDVELTMSGLLTLKEERWNAYYEEIIGPKDPIFFFTSDDGWIAES